MAERTRVLFKQLTPTSWVVQMGEGLEAFIDENAPAFVTAYNWVVLHGASVDDVLVTRLPMVLTRPGSAQAVHSLADTLELTAAGDELLMGSRRTKQVYRRTLVCRHRRSGTTDRPGVAVLADCVCLSNTYALILRSL